jgi:hypothetical protein
MSLQLFSLEAGHELGKNMSKKYYRRRGHSLDLLG